MINKVFPGGRGRKKPHQDTTVRVPREFADVMKYMANAYRWQLRHGVSPKELKLWVEQFHNLIYDKVDERIEFVEKTMKSK